MRLEAHESAGTRFQGGADPCARRRVALYIAASLDGHIARRDGSVDWLPHPAREEDYGYADFLRRVDTLVMGRKTYDQTRAFGAWPYGERHCVVFSRSRAGRRDRHAEFVDGDIARHVRYLRAQPGRNIWLVGGGEVLNPCLSGGVVDEIVLSIPPILLGDGLPLFLPRAVTTRLHLTDCHAYPDGLVQLSYEVVR
jgi:dihydrofolate reductase